MNYFILQKQVLLLWCIVVINEHVLFFLVSVSYSTRRMPLVEQELSALPEHMSSLPILNGVRGTRFLVLCVCFVDRCLSLSIFVIIVLSVLLRFTASDYPVGIFKLF